MAELDFYKKNCCKMLLFFKLHSYLSIQNQKVKKTKNKKQFLFHPRLLLGSDIIKCLFIYLYLNVLFAGRGHDPGQRTDQKVNLLKDMGKAQSE